MRTKIVILIVAVVLGATAAVLAANYLRQARSDIASESEPIKILVATDDIPRGVNADELLAQKVIVLQEVPRRFVAAGAVSAPAAIEGQVLSVPLTAGEQVTEGRFEFPATAGLAYSIPKQYVALAIPVDAVKGVAGLVKPGDHVGLYVTFSPGPQGEDDFTKMLIPDSKVLAVGTSLRAASASNGEGSEGGGVISASRSDTAEQEIASTLTLAVSTADAERIVFAEETGKVWAMLLPASAEEIPATSGQTLNSILR